MSTLTRKVLELEKRAADAGDSLAFTPNLPHGTVCIETGTLLDIFTPMREDFISK